MVRQQPKSANSRSVIAAPTTFLPANAFTTILYIIASSYLSEGTPFILLALDFWADDG